MSNESKGIGDPDKNELISQGSQIAQQVAGKALENANTKVKNTSGDVQAAAQAAQQAQSYIQSGQQAADKIMQQQAAANSTTVNGSNSNSNAAAIASMAMQGVVHLVSLKIIVDGSEIKHYKSFNLNQSAVNHHSFTLVLAHDSIGSPQNQQLEDAQKLLGKRISVTFAYKNISGGPEREFIGVITRLGLSREHGSLGNIILTGQSPTILLDAAPHIQSFGGEKPTNLNTVVESILNEGLGGSKFDFKISPKYISGINYICQYDETHYNFLARTAEAYGEQFFYDGTTIYFGKLPLAGQPIELTYGRDLSEVQVQMNIQHIIRSHYGYNSSKDEVLTAGATKVEPKGTLAKQAYQVSESVFKTPSLRIAPIKATTNQDIEAAQKSTSGSIATTVFTTSGSTTVPFLYPGSEVKLNFKKNNNGEAEYFTQLKIIEISHYVDDFGHYTGSFEAIDANPDFIPMPVFHTPKAEAQIATVTDNVDTQGRIKVKFDWQMGDNTSEWIRVATLNAGSSNDVPKNRGLVFIPEKDDQVMVGFVHNHPDRPYVMHSMFTGKTGSGGGSDNNTKSIITKSKVSITFDDGKGSLTLTDKGQESISLDGAGNIAISAASSISITTGKSSITLKSDGTIDISGINITTNGTVIQVIGSDSITESSGPTSVSLSKDGKATVNGTDASMNGSNTATLSGNSKATLTATGMAVIDGAIVKLN